MGLWCGVIDRSMGDGHVRKEDEVNDLKLKLGLSIHPTFIGCVDKNNISKIDFIPGNIFFTSDDNTLYVIGEDYECHKLGDDYENK